jgi:hypothetical protein
MRRVKALSLLLLCLSLYDCDGQTQIAFSDELMNQYPSDPAMFHSRYGGRLRYFNANTEAKEKMANIDQAVVDGDGFEVVFWKKKEFYIHHIILTKNHLKVGNVAVIGKRQDEIQRVFGNPATINEQGTMIYRGKAMDLTLAVKDGTVKYCYWGFEI